jgi:hypothetical protein
MNVIRLRFAVLGIAVVLLTACDRNLGQSANEFIGDINNEVLKDIRKSFPVPEQTIVNNANGKVVNYSTTLTVQQVVEFYRQSYPQRGGVEMPEEASVSGDSAKLAFHTSDGGSVYIRIEKDDTQTKVKLEKK